MSARPASKLSCESHAQAPATKSSASRFRSSTEVPPANLPCSAAAEAFADLRHAGCCQIETGVRLPLTIRRTASPFYTGMSQIRGTKASSTTTLKGPSSASGL